MSTQPTFEYPLDKKNVLKMRYGSTKKKSKKLKNVLKKRFGPSKKKW